MSRREILFRLGEKAKRLQSKRRHGSFAEFESASGILPELPILSARLAKGLSDPARAVIEADVANLMGGRIEALGKTWHLDRDHISEVPAALWHMDPATGRRWSGSERYCFDISYRHARDIGDVKYVWEINRLQFLQSVAAKALLDGDDFLREWCLSALRSWCEANPPFQGINWCSGIELALRSITVVIVISLIGAARIDPNNCRLIRAMLAAHAYWLARYPSAYSSANNHLIAEGVALLMLGTLMPDLPNASRYADLGRRICEREALLQVLHDGIGAEQSITYLCFSLELLMLAGLTARASGQSFSATFDRRLHRAAEALSWLIDRQGRTAAIGDNDEGRVIVSGSTREPRYPASILASLCGYLGDPALAPTSRDAHLRDALFEAPLAPGCAPEGMRVFPTGGYTVIRERRCGRQLHIIIDHGPLGYLSIAAHGHADALAIWLTLDEEPVLVDAGTYLYHSGGVWRDHFRGTRAHNTLVVAERDQSRLSGPFNWSRRAQARLHSATPGEEWEVIASHDGYLRDLGIEHVRRVNATNCGIVIHDSLAKAARPLPVEIGFLFHPDLEIKVEHPRASITRSGKELLYLETSSAFEIRVEAGAIERTAGWYSEAFGEKRPATRLSFCGDLGSTPHRTTFVWSLC